jgi:TRAP-type mannitol/chloroaromatic compound transport system substrate-binding protein
MSGGRIEITLHPPGAICPVKEQVDAVHKGMLDGSFSPPSYWLGKNNAFTLYAAVPGGPFGMDKFDHLAWIMEGGGQELFNELYQDVLGYNIISYPHQTEFNEPMGWFAFPIEKLDDLKGVKFRIAGLVLEAYKAMGMAPVMLGGGEIVPALEKGLIDGTDYSDPEADMALGIMDCVKYYHLPGMHQPASIDEMMINRDSWNALPDDLKLIVEATTQKWAFRNWAMMMPRAAAAMDELIEEHGVIVVETPMDVMLEILRQWDIVAEAESAKNPAFKKVYDSQRDFASQVVPLRRLSDYDYSLAADYYWPPKY